MKNVLFIGILGAVFTGLFIGSQATLSSRLGSLIGPTRTGLWMNIIGGTIGLLIVIIIALFTKENNPPIPLNGWVMLAAAGLLGVFIVMGTAFALPKIGVTAGIGGLILGQLLVSTVIDARGWSGNEPIPVDLPRIAGLLLLTFAVYLLLPRNS